MAGKILPLTSEPVFCIIVNVTTEHMFEQDNINTQLFILAVQDIENLDVKINGIPNIYFSNS